MPPKKKGKKGTGKGKTKSNTDMQASEEDKEDLLQKELDKLAFELESSKEEVNKLRTENEWLQKEANRVRLESHEYMSYIEKKTSKRQAYIVSLSDHNSHEIRKITEQKEKMLQDYSSKKAALQNILLEKENRLARVKLELEGLGEFKRLQDEQSEKIQKLEKQIQHVRREQTQRLQDMKDSFTAQKQETQRSAEAVVKDTITRSNQEATAHLNEHTNRIKEENVNLRSELLRLIQQTRLLQTHRDLLKQQHVELCREQQYARDLKAIRTERQRKLAEKRLGQESPEQAIISTSDGVAQGFSRLAIE